MDCTTTRRLASESGSRSTAGGSEGISMAKIIRKVLQGLLPMLAVCSMMPVRGWASDENAELAQRLDASAKVLNEVMADPQKSIPDGIMRRATCVVVFPSMVQVAVLLGAKH